MLQALTTGMLLDYLGIRLVGPLAAQHPMVVNLNISDTDERVRLELSNGALISTFDRLAEEPDASLTISRAGLAMLALGAMTPDQLSADDALIEGDRTRLDLLFSLCEAFDPAFEIVRP